MEENFLPPEEYASLQEAILSELKVPSSAKLARPLLLQTFFH